MGNIAAHWKTFKQKFEIYMIASGNYAKIDTIKIALLPNIMGQEGKYAKMIQAFEEHTTLMKNEAYER
ncbi:hypothetical protein PR048_008010 [Dryococelus australis]|uniref:Uncharacterized protein n=1 Tax=Dryococelus australis TaxID=614101 RepID=A0ABQ9HWQ1_9NEOP|nr:hypothetical protein PR048_008010 [Dryococelus australis]